MPWPPQNQSMATGTSSLEQRLVVGDGLVEGEERVDRAVDEQGRHGDVVDQVAGPAVEEPGLVLVAERAGSARPDSAALVMWGSSELPAATSGEERRPTRP